MKLHKRAIKIIWMMSCISPISPLILSLSSCSYYQWKYVDIVSLNNFAGHIDSSLIKHNPAIAPAPIIDDLALLYTYIKLEDQVGNKTDKYQSTYFILNGDNCIGTPYSDLSNGKYTYDLLKEFEPKYSTVGDHEFAWGQKYLDPQLAEAAGNDTFAKMGDLTSFLSCNIYTTNTNTGKYEPVNWTQPYAITKIDKLNVGFVGYTTALANTDNSVINLSGISIADATDNTTEFTDTNLTGTQILQNAIDNCKNDTLNLNNGIKPDVVILLAHEGANFKPDRTIDTNSAIYRIINNINHIDACIAGNTTIEYTGIAPDKDNKQIPWGQAASYGEGLLQTKVTYDTEHKSHFSISMDKRSIVDQKKLSVNELIDKDRTQEFVKKLNNHFNEIYDQFNSKYQTNTFNVADQSDNKKYTKDNNVYIPYSTSIFNSQVSPIGAFYNQAMGTILSKDALNNISTYPELNNIKQQIINFDSNFNGVDIALTSTDKIIKDLVSTKNNSNNDITNKNLYDLSIDNNNLIFDDDNVVIIKLTVKDLLKYFNTYRKVDAADLFYSDKYLLKYDKDSYKSCRNIKLVDKITKQEIDSSTPIFIALNNSFYLDLNAKWIDAAGDNHWIISAEGGKTNNKFQILSNPRGIIIEYAYILNQMSSIDDSISDFPVINLGATSGIDIWNYKDDNYFYK